MNVFKNQCIFTSERNLKKSTDKFCTYCTDRTCITPHFFFSSSFLFHPHPFIHTYTHKHAYTLAGCYSSLYSLSLFYFLSLYWIFYDCSEIFNYQKYLKICRQIKMKLFETTLPIRSLNAHSGSLAVYFSLYTLCDTWVNQASNNLSDIITVSCAAVESPVGSHTRACTLKGTGDEQHSCLGETEKAGDYKGNLLLLWCVCVCLYCEHACIFMQTIYTVWPVY